MKHILAWMLTLALLAVPAALAKGHGELSGGTNLTPNEPLSVDLDGDGTEETVFYQISSDNYVGRPRMTVTDSDGKSCVWDAENGYEAGSWIADLNGDDVQELFVWGDVASSDYYTTCLNYVNGRLRPLLFADIERGENGKGYFKEGYGCPCGANPEQGTVTLCGSQDVLGTWFGARKLKLSEDGLFEIADDGWWTRHDIPEGDEAWDEWWPKTLLKDVDCLIDGREGMLKAGERIIITGSDKRSQASFITEDGRTGILRIEENLNGGWGWKVNDIPEEEVFDFLGYAD